jgi:hypothetical protein
MSWRARRTFLRVRTKMLGQMAEREQRREVPGTRVAVLSDEQTLTAVDAAHQRHTEQHHGHASSSDVRTRTGRPPVQDPGPGLRPAGERVGGDEPREAERREREDHEPHPRELLTEDDHRHARPVRLRRECNRRWHGLWTHAIRPDGK